MDLLISNVQLQDRRRMHLCIDEGRIAAVLDSQMPSPASKAMIDGRDYVALPAFVDSHLHLDKTLWGLPWVSNGGGPTRREYIAHEQRILAQLDMPIAERAAALLRQMRRCGTLFLRSHVDISPEFGLRHITALLALRESWGDEVTLQLVAFPQTGLLSRPGTLELMTEAMQMGADVVGGIDPAGFDQDPMGHLRAIFGLAERFDKPIDLHLHDPAELGAWEIERIADFTEAAGLQGRVMISHAYGLGAVSEVRAGAIAERLARLDISIMTAAPAWGPAPPVALLRACGVNVCCGSDGIRDAWSPFGTGDMLERAMLLSQRFGWATDDELDYATQAVTGNGAKALGVTDYGIAPGCSANLVLVQAEVPEEIATKPSIARIVLRRGAVIASKSPNDTVSQNTISQ